MRNVGWLVFSALERVNQQTKIDQVKKDLETKVNQLITVAKAALEGDSSRTEKYPSSSEELSASAEELSAQAGSLKNVISGFKV